MTGSDGALASDNPTAFRADTENLTGWPFVNPVTAHEVVAVTHTSLPSISLAVYSNTGSPPSTVGANQLRLTVPSPRSAVTSVGGVGIVAGITGALCALTAESPLEVRATTMAV
jgi:hypothetical protein